MQFDSPSLLRLLLEADDQALDTLPFGVVGMDLNGTVRRYNRFESDLSGMRPETVIGRHFFTEVAPCTNNFMVAGRYDGEETLDEALDYVFTYRMAPTKVRLRLLKDTALGCQYLCVRRPSAAAD